MSRHAPKILLLTPPMVQLNTPYPATPVLTGFLKGHGADVVQADLSLEVALKLFSSGSVREAESRLLRRKRVSAEERRFLAAVGDYAENVGPVVSFLQGKSPEMAWKYSRRGVLPEGPHFRELTPDSDSDPDETLDELFGSQGIEGKAKMLASLFLDDLAAILSDALDPDFAFARYAERLAVAAPSFDTIHKRLNGQDSYIDRILALLVREQLEKGQPDYVGVTVPFPGTVWGAFRIAEEVRRVKPDVKTVLGGGYVNSELRDMTDERVFDFFDYICYDEGFQPWLGIIGKGPLVRTRIKGSTPGSICESAKCFHAAPRPYEVVVSDYTGLDLSRYLSIVETANPMHRLWSDGRWLKVQLASGCYWHKCRFCDVALDYIGRYMAPDPVQAVDALVKMKTATGVSAFHFTDEAVPPALMRSISEEILRRGEKIVWWGNVRFDKGFSRSLALLMAEAGCIGVTGGLECATDRLLSAMNKGISLAGARAACEAFADAGILVHTYLMYGYPSETLEDTIEALEFVRDLFADGCIQSAFWHRFALTVHSPLAADPPKGLVAVTPPPPKHGRFALNEIDFDKSCSDARGDEIGKALSLAVYNFMLGRGYDLPASFWFEGVIGQ